MDSGKKISGAGPEPQVQPGHYSHSYDSKRRFVSYWHQLNEIIEKKPENVLEIGIGNGFLSRQLRHAGFDVTTVDFDQRLNPDVVASSTQLPFQDNSFDVVAAFEILEHIAYEQALGSLSEMKRVSKNFIIFSVPDAAHTYRVEIQMPLWGNIRKLIRLGIFPREKSPISQHLWEVELKDYPLSKIISDIEKLDCKLEKTYQVFENHRHRFFILKKSKKDK